MSALQCPKNNDAKSYPVDWATAQCFGTLGTLAILSPSSIIDLENSGDLGAQVLLLGQLCSRLGLLFGTESPADSMGPWGIASFHQSSPVRITEALQTASPESPSKHFQTDRFCNCGSMC